MLHEPDDCCQSFIPHHMRSDAGIFGTPQDVDSFLRNATDTVAILEIAVKKINKKAEKYASDKFSSSTFHRDLNHNCPYTATLGPSLWAT